MIAKQHYEKFLAPVYSWMLGDFEKRMIEQQDFFQSHHISPVDNALAFDLGAGSGIQSLALANLGFNVRAVDFCLTLLQELDSNCKGLPVETIEQDILHYLKSTPDKAELIVCMGDTITHLADRAAVKEFVERAASSLVAGGKIIVSFRDLSEERKGTDRFIPVRADDTRIMSCFLEYFPLHVLVHDIVHEKIGSTWTQKISTYRKLRLHVSTLLEEMVACQFEITYRILVGGMTYVIGQKR